MLWGLGGLPGLPGGGWAGVSCLRVAPAEMVALLCFMHPGPLAALLGLISRGSGGMERKPGAQTL